MSSGMRQFFIQNVRSVESSNRTWSIVLKTAALVAFRKFGVPAVSQALLFWPPFHLRMLLAPMYPVTVR